MLWVMIRLQELQGASAAALDCNSSIAVIGPVIAVGVIDPVEK